MKIPCGICNPCDELIPPYTNLSAEIPDQYYFWSTYYGNPQSPPRIGSLNPDDPTQSWGASWCRGTCVSTISQQDADACAAAESLSVCDPIDPGTGSRYPIYYNTRQVCGGTCPDGVTTYSFEVPAGTYAALSQAQANQMALSFACRFANQNRHCPPNSSVCPNVPLPINFDVYVVHGILFGPVDFTFTVTSGSLPPGVSLVKTSNTVARLVGTPTQIGMYNWTVTAAFMGYSIAYTSRMGVLGITNLPLPNASVGTPYSYQLQFTGNLHTVTVVVNNAPTWMTVSSSGLITGIPATADMGTTSISFVVTDA